MSNTPRPYLSYSQLSTLERSETNYIASYIWNKRSAPNEFLKLGKKLHEALEHREKPVEDWLEEIRKQIPDYPIREHKIETKLNNIPLLGLLDGFDPKKNRIGEYKTGLKPNIAGWTNQMLFYSLMVWLEKGKKLKKIDIFWAETKWNDEGQLIFSGQVRNFNIKIKMKDIIRFTARVDKAWKRIHELCENERQQFGKLPFDK